jgi:hypothetical protein
MNGSIWCLGGRVSPHLRHQVRESARAHVPPKRAAQRALLHLYPNQGKAKTNRPLRRRAYGERCRTPACTAMRKLRIVALSGFRVGDRSRGRFATPADSPRHDCIPYSHAHVRRVSLGCVPRSRTIFLSPHAQILSVAICKLLHRCTQHPNQHRLTGLAGVDWLTEHALCRSHRACGFPRDGVFCVGGPPAGWRRTWPSDPA